MTSYAPPRKLSSGSSRRSSPESTTTTATYRHGWRETPPFAWKSDSNEVAASLQYRGGLL